MRFVVESQSLACIEITRVRVGLVFSSRNLPNPFGLHEWRGGDVLEWPPLSLVAQKRSELNDSNSIANHLCVGLPGRLLASHNGRG